MDYLIIDTEKRDKKYNLWARQYPACISLSFGFVIFLYYLITTEKMEVDNVKYIFNTLLSLGSIVPALFFLYMFVIRDISKWLEDCIYALYGKPTTNLLTIEDTTFSKDRQNDIRQRITTEFSQFNAGGNYSKTNKDYCKSVDEIVLNIREKTRESNILFEFNCIYGFYRNLSGGLLLNLLLLMLIFLLFPIVRDLIVGLFLIDLSLFILSLILTASNGKRYAKRLYIVYLMTKKD